MSRIMHFVLVQEMIFIMRAAAAAIVCICNGYYVHGFSWKIYLYFVYKCVCVWIDVGSFHHSLASLASCAFWWYDLLGTTATFRHAMQFTLHTTTTPHPPCTHFVPPHSCALCASHTLSMCISTMTSFMQYAFQVQFNTSFNTTRANLYLHLRSKNGKVFWA